MVFNYSFPTTLFSFLRGKKKPAGKITSKDFLKKGKNKKTQSKIQMMLTSNPHQLSDHSEMPCWIHTVSVRN